MDEITNARRDAWDDHFDDPDILDRPTPDDYPDTDEEDTPWPPK